MNTIQGLTITGENHLKGNRFLIGSDQEKMDQLKKSAEKIFKGSIFGQIFLILASPTEPKNGRR